MRTEERRRAGDAVADHRYIILSYATYVLLAVAASMLLFSVVAAVVIVEESVRLARTHEKKHEIVRRYPTST
jgi:heme exporter protein D